MRALSSFFAIQGTRRPDTALISAVESWTILEDSNLRVLDNLLPEQKLFPATLCDGTMGGGP